MPLTRLRAVALLAAGLMGVAGCAASPAAAPTGSQMAISPEDDVPPPTEQVLRLHLPIDSYVPSVDEIYRIEAATDVLTQRCMASRGISWPLINRPVFGDWRNRRRYGVIEPLVAQGYGFHAVPALLSPVQVYNEKVRRANALTDRERADLSDPNTGCAPRASAELRKGVTEPDYTVANQLGAQSLSTAEKSPEVRIALGKWSDCVLAAGYHYSDPLSASADKRWTASPTASPPEVVAAETGVRCAQETDLVGIWSNADAAVQRDQISRNAGYFAAMASAKAQLLSAAAKVINAGP